MNLLRRAIGGIGWLAICLLIAAAGALLAVRLSGRSIMAVQTGSMRPAFWPGDAILVRPQPTPSIPIGAIVSYHSLADPSVIVSHRLVRRNPDNGWLVTKGDRLNENDPAIPPNRVVGRVTARLPRLGAILNTVRRPYVLAGLVYLPCVWLLYGQIYRLLLLFSKPRYRLKE